MTEPTLTALADLEFRSRFVDALPGDHSLDATPRKTPGVAYSLANPVPVRAPTLIGWSRHLAAEIGLAGDPPTDRDIALLSGCSTTATMRPYAARYGGHQFGHWAGQLGDGRAITLGEFQTVTRDKTLELQLKGAGKTPYSRTADGLAVLRSSVREFLCSEAMHFLGIPTTRALSIVTTGEGVVRDMFYDGNPKPEPGAITARVAPSFLRFGNFEIFAATGERQLLKQLVDHTIATHFPEIQVSAIRSSGSPNESTDVYLAWFHEVCRRTARLVAEWQRVGFVHGVMNTDNMSILGLTIDYGPYGWLEVFDPMWTPNTTDLPGRRYCFGRQPAIAQWNLARLGEAIMGLWPEAQRIEFVESGLKEFVTTYGAVHSRHLAAKLGLTEISGDDDWALIEELFELMTQDELDFPIFFDQLSRQKTRATRHWNDLAVVHEALYNPTETSETNRTRWLQWFVKYHGRINNDPMIAAQRHTCMSQANPRFILRNYLVQQAIDDLMDGSKARFERLLERLTTPYEDAHDDSELCAKRPDWARTRPGCATLSCSS